MDEPVISLGFMIQGWVLLATRCIGSWRVCITLIFRRLIRSFFSCCHDEILTWRITVWRLIYIDWFKMWVCYIIVLSVRLILAHILAVSRSLPLSVCSWPDPLMWLNTPYFSYVCAISRHIRFEQLTICARAYGGIVGALPVPIFKIWFIWFKGWRKNAFI